MESPAITELERPDWLPAQPQGKVRWGVLGVANIAVKKVIPAMQKGKWSQVLAIASRDLAKSEAAAQELGIPKAYGSYEEMLDDPEIEAVYNPLPNHMHVPWSVRSAYAGKHVLCEKPVSLSAKEAEELLLAGRNSGVKVGEAFMVRTHPQWQRTRELVNSGEIGDLRSVMGFFSYFNRDPNNVRNNSAMGGGGLMDVGCYPIHTSRFVYGEEPTRVLGLLEDDPEFGVDRLASAILDFPSGQSIFTCSTQLVPCQRMQFFGTKGRVEVEIPFNAPPGRPCRIFVDNGQDVFGSGIREEEFPVCDQYRIQGDLFSRAIREGTPVPVPIEDSIKNMQVIDAIFRSGKTGKWETP